MKKVTINGLAKEAGVPYMTVWNLKKKLGRMPSLDEIKNRRGPGRPEQEYEIGK